MEDWTELEEGSSGQRLARLTARAVQIKSKRKLETARPVSIKKQKREAAEPIQRKVVVNRGQHRRRHTFSSSKKKLAHHKLNFNLPSTDADLLHWKTCTRRACCQCYFARFKSKWQKQAPWLQGRSKDDGGFMLGCAICESAGRDAHCKWARFEVADFGRKQPFRITNILRHGATKKHCAAAGGRDDTSIVQGVSVPTQADFKTVMKCLFASEGAGAKGIKNVGTGNKIRKLKYCCAEGARIITRSQLRSALTLAIHQDVRKARLLVRYTACNSKLEVFSGTFGQIKLPRTLTLDADGIKAGTLKVIKTFSLTRCRPPSCGRERRLIDTKLAQHIRDIVELWDTDAAGNSEANALKQAWVNCHSCAFRFLVAKLRARSARAVAQCLRRRDLGRQEDEGRNQHHALLRQDHARKAC